MDGGEPRSHRLRRRPRWARRARVSPAGIADTRNNLCGYVVVEAESHDEAARMFENHPHFAIFPGEAVEVLECLTLPLTPQGAFFTRPFQRFISADRELAEFTGALAFATRPMSSKRFRFAAEDLLNLPVEASNDGRGVPAGEQAAPAGEVVACHAALRGGGYGRIHAVALRRAHRQRAQGPT